MQSRAVQDRSISIAKAAETISGNVEKIIRNSMSSAGATGVLADMAGRLKLQLVAVPLAAIGFRVFHYASLQGGRGGVFL